MTAKVIVILRRHKPRLVRGKRRTDLDWDAVLADYSSGEVMWRIAARWGVTPKSIRKRARKAGLPPRKSRVSAAREKKIIAMYRRGVLWKEICVRAGIDSTTLGEVLKRNAVPMRTPMWARARHASRQ